MYRRQRRLTAAALDAGEGFIDVLFLLLTFFIVQNVWQTAVSEAHTQFIHAQMLDFVKAADPKKNGPKTADDSSLQIIVGSDFVRFVKGGIMTEEIAVFQDTSDREESDIEQAVFAATEQALVDVLHGGSYQAETVLVRLYFERHATIIYTVGVYDALNKTGFQKFHWGLRDPNKNM